MDEYYNQLLNYIKQSLDKGYSEEAIRTMLIQGGIDADVIDHIFSTVRQPSLNEVISEKPTPVYAVLTKAGTISVVIVIILLVRTTGALQQNAPTVSPNTGQITTAPTVGAPSDQYKSGGDDTATPSPQPSSSSTPSTSPSSTPATTKAIVQAQVPVKTSTAPVPPKQTVPSPSAPPPPTYTYKNGTYTATGSCSTPGGNEPIAIMLSITNDVVTATSATNQANNATSRNYENIFINNYQSLVVGKSLKTLSLGKVSSASLTPVAFNNAVTTIRSEAKG